jgi:hypothetical protein
MTLNKQGSTQRRGAHDERWMNVKQIFKKLKRKLRRESGKLSSRGKLQKSFSDAKRSHRPMRMYC